MPPSASVFVPNSFALGRRNTLCASYGRSTAWYKPIIVAVDNGQEIVTARNVDTLPGDRLRSGGVMRKPQEP